MALSDKKEVEEQSYPEDNVVKKKVISCFKGVRLLQTLVIMACIAIVFKQISACVRKLIDIPVTTYTHFDFNKTIVYPSVTFCREPAYKYEKMMLDISRHRSAMITSTTNAPRALNLSQNLHAIDTVSYIKDHQLYSHPRFTSMWINYNFSLSLDDLWTDITYKEQDIFVQFGLDGSMENVDIHETIGFVMGRCYTMTPKVQGTHASKASGYSITLRHSTDDIAAVSGIYPPGYHVYVHYTREPFTEVEVYNGGLVQTLFVNVGESMDVKLTVDEYLKISDEDDPCSFEDNYSANICTAQYVWNLAGDQAGCSGPWMTSDLPRCTNYTDMRNLIIAYMNSYNSHNCDSCPRFCRSYLYNSFVTDRQSFYIWDSAIKQWSLKTADAALQTQLYIYFNSMMVSVYEERYNYDWNLFLSDLGGSIGFLLGLSVIGLIKIFGQTWEQFIRPYVKSSTRSASVAGSTVTVDVTDKYPETEKENDWK